MPFVPEPTLNTTRRRAAQVFAESAICGYLLGFGAAFSVTLVLVAGNASANGARRSCTRSSRAGSAAGWACSSACSPASRAGCSSRAGERRLGARAVAWLLPVVGLAVSLPVASLFALPGDASWRVLVLSIAVVLTLVGSAVVASRYLRRAEWVPVH